MVEAIIRWIMEWMDEVAACLWQAFERDMALTQAIIEHVETFFDSRNKQ